MHPDQEDMVSKGSPLLISGWFVLVGGGRVLLTAPGSREGEEEEEENLDAFDI